MVDAFFAAGGVLESTARALFVHPNTVRYRLRRIGEVTGFAPLVPRDAFALRIALTIGRLDPSAIAAWTAQPGSLDAESGIMSSIFDHSGSRLICGEADKTSK